MKGFSLLCSREMFEKRFHASVGVSDLYKMKEIVLITEEDSTGKRNKLTIKELCVCWPLLFRPHGATSPIPAGTAAAAAGGATVATGALSTGRTQFLWGSQVREVVYSVNNLTLKIFFFEWYLNP